MNQILEWGGYCDDLGENWLRNNATVLYYVIMVSHCTSKFTEIVDTYLQGQTYMLHMRDSISTGFQHIYIHSVHNMIHVE